MSGPKCVLKSQADLNPDLLPQEALPVAQLEFRAISQKRVGRKFLWHLEMELGPFLAIQKSALQAKKLRTKNASLGAENKQLAKQNEELLIKNENLKSNNEQLMRNIAEDTRPDRFLRSPKNYLNVANEKPYTTLSQLPMAGGFAGLEKK